MKKLTKQPKPIIFTKAGYEKLQNEYDTLLQERPLAVEQLKKAREMGDLSENGFYKAAKAKLASLDHQIQMTKHMLRYGTISQHIASEMVQIGTTVTIDDGGQQKTLTIVGERESNPSVGNISFKSPIGGALLGKKKDETIQIQTPKGLIAYRITSIIQ